jgi:hypothetical protein
MTLLRQGGILDHHFQIPLSLRIRIPKALFVMDLRSPLQKE